MSSLVHIKEGESKIFKSILAGVDTLWLKIVIVVMGVGDPSSSMLGLRVVAATRGAGLVGIAGDGIVIVGPYQGKINVLTNGARGEDTVVDARVRGSHRHWGLVTVRPY